MILPDSEIVVMDLAGNYVRILCGDAKSARILLALGFSMEGEQFVKAINNEPERQQLTNELIKLRAVFSAGRDWSPAELLDYYREQGVVCQPYRVISWTRKDTFVIRDC